MVALQVDDARYLKEVGKVNEICIFSLYVRPGQEVKVRGVSVCVICALFPFMWSRRTTTRWAV